MSDNEINDINQETNQELADIETEETGEVEETEAVEAEEAVEEESKRAVEEIFDWVEIFSGAFLTVILLFTFIFRLVTVQGPSMELTLHGGNPSYIGAESKDRLLMSNLFYTPKQGDIVVIQVPNPKYDMPIIKRVIATEGQTVDIDFDNWIIYVDGEALDEPYVNREANVRMEMGDIIYEMLPITVEEGKIFVMGDNRNHSSDSRSSSIGQVDVRNVVGRALLRVFPINKFGVVKPHES